MLFSGKYLDLRNALGYVDVCSKSIGIGEVAFEPDIVISCLMHSRDNSHYQSTGFDDASIFRKLAVFSAYFVSQRPILEAFPKEKIGEELATINNHQNAILALQIAIRSLYGATINRKDGIHTLKNRIVLSKHSYVDIVDALTTITPDRTWKLASVLFEQMSYRFNHDCSYPLS